MILPIMPFAMTRGSTGSSATLSTNTGNFVDHFCWEDIQRLARKGAALALQSKAFQKGNLEEEPDALSPSIPLIVVKGGCRAYGGTFLQISLVSVRKKQTRPGKYSCWLLGRARALYLLLITRGPQTVTISSHGGKFSSGG
ncbi:hypothetical protein CDL15_Pgr022853 [Punica granatum]|uniref:Uncharacterized protein n=1 Tax=Punica granatum TaxID=22663 RepID=A0A218X4L9_PUNGR|nr:hypothetical protein CDL15_Pgr022853 [Punica granatum]